MRCGIEHDMYSDAYVVHMAGGRTFSLDAQQVRGARGQWAGWDMFGVMMKVMAGEWP